MIMITKPRVRLRIGLQDSMNSVSVGFNTRNLSLVVVRQNSD